MPRYVNIPQYPQPGQPRALFDREPELVQLTRSLVLAGNALKGGDEAVRHRHLVHGYRGVGKSSVIVEALSIIRGEPARIALDGQPVVSDLPEPLEPERWLLLRVSGKSAPSFQHLSKAVTEAVEPGATDRRDPLLAIAPQIAAGAERQIPRATQLSFFHRLLVTRERELYESVRRTLGDALLAIEYVQRWLGAVEHRQLLTAGAAQSQTDLETGVEAELGALVGTGAGAALKLAARTIVKEGLVAGGGTEVRQRRFVDVRIVVAALNEFFGATRRARLPTILVIDDLDDFTAEVGPSFGQRAEMLNLVLGPLCELEPTCLVVAVRSEYNHEEFTRKFDGVLQIPPMPRDAVDGVLAVWGKAQSPPFSGDDLDRWTGVLRPFFGPIPSGERRVFVPEAWLSLAQWIYNGQESGDAATVLRQFVVGKHGEQVADAVEALARRLTPDTRALQCLAGEAMDPEGLSPGPAERAQLERGGYLRPAIAGDLAERSIVLHPLVGVLALLSRP